MTEDSEKTPTREHSTTAKSKENSSSGRVAQILNEREVVINLGAEHGVKEGMRFAILAEEVLDILDPETGEPLGTIDREKVRVQATEVKPKFAICRTFHFRTVGSTLSALSGSTTLADMFGPERKVYETLDAEKEDFPAPLAPEESYVKIGDRVQRVAKMQDE